ncbi:MAG: transketolase [Elusimicrobia bacterium]|nr:transketolase [Elusimicrobiota bacterium]
MRSLLADLIARAAERDPDFLALSGDHGYALFDPIRKDRPGQFLNVGVMEQAMVGIAAGLCKQGFRPMLYGLSAFVPIRVLEQIKLDVCFPGLPVIFVGDGAGLVYSTLGASHQCGEDVAALRPLPNIRIYSPCDAEELRACWREILGRRGPCYLRVGKSDRPAVHQSPLQGTEPHFTHQVESSKTCLVAHGSMAVAATERGRAMRLPVLSVPRVKPLGDAPAALLRPFSNIIVLEEHSRHGGLASALAELFCGMPPPAPRIRAVALEDKFAARCGSYQYALSEHRMADHQLEARIGELLD